MAAPLLTGYLALGTGSGTTFTEMTGTGYARQSITLLAFLGSATRIQSGVTFAAGSTWSAKTQLGVYDAVTGGDLLFFWNSRSPVVLHSGQTHTVSAGSFNITFQTFSDTASPLVLVIPTGAICGITEDGSPVYAGTTLQFSNGQIGAFS